MDEMQYDLRPPKMRFRERICYRYIIMKHRIADRMNRFAIEGEHSDSIFRQNIARGWHYQDAKEKR